MYLKKFTTLVLLLLGIFLFESCSEEYHVDNYSEAAAAGDKCKYEVTAAETVKGETLPEGVAVRKMVCTPCSGSCEEKQTDRPIKNIKGDTIGYFSGDLKHSAAKCSSCNDGTSIRI